GAGRGVAVVPAVGGGAVCVALAAGVCVGLTGGIVCGRAVAGAVGVVVGGTAPVAPLTVGIAGGAVIGFVLAPTGVDWLIGGAVACPTPVARIVGRRVTVGRVVGADVTVAGAPRPPAALVAVTVKTGALALLPEPWEPKTRVAMSMTAISATATPRAPSSAARVRAGV
nr:hypothetical protein [Chloroflexota bacterium]